VKPFLAVREAPTPRAQAEQAGMKSAGASVLRSTLNNATIADAATGRTNRTARKSTRDTRRVAIGFDDCKSTAALP
jgi:hypothetical protein